MRTYEVEKVVLVNGSTKNIGNLGEYDSLEFALVVADKNVDDLGINEEYQINQFEDDEETGFQACTCVKVIKSRKNRYIVRDREAGNVIEAFDHLEQAQNEVKEYEEQDKEDGSYTPHFYEIYDVIDEEIWDC